jgi:integrase
MPLLVPHRKARTLTFLRCRAIAPFSEKQRDDLIAAVRATKPQYGDVIEILALTGIRWGALCSLRVLDLLQEPYPAIMVRRSESDGYDPADPKSGKPRRVPLDDRAAEILTARALDKGSGRPALRERPWEQALSGWVDQICELVSNRPREASLRSPAHGRDTLVAVRNRHRDNRGLARPFEFCDYPPERTFTI